MKRIHFIAIGGSAMHNLAIVLKEKGYTVSGSDDEIFEPSRSRLQSHGLLPEQVGWFPQRITHDMDAIVLGMHARADNPELIKAKELGLKIYSYPEYLYEQTKNKTRVVVGGSHGKTTITSMIMHVLKESGKRFDYMVGAQIEGFTNMVNLNDNTELAIFEGDEYLTSPMDPRPKFHLYKPHIAVISGIAWDHINVFPTQEIYAEQFEIFTNTIESNGNLIFYQNDKTLAHIAENTRPDIKLTPYVAHPFVTKDNTLFLQTPSKPVEIAVFGNHNMENIMAAKEVCTLLGITDEQFYQSISTFTGASKRMQLLAKSKTSAVYLDFAHAPSKVKATVKALQEAYPQRKLVACLELHTYSSLNKDFLKEYRDSLNPADDPIVFYSPRAIELKKLAPLAPEFVKEQFGNEQVLVFNDSSQLKAYLEEHSWQNTNLLLMSSGNFGGINLPEIAKMITG